MNSIAIGSTQLPSSQAPRTELLDPTPKKSMTFAISDDDDEEDDQGSLSILEREEEVSPIENRGEKEKPVATHPSEINHGEKEKPSAPPAAPPPPAAPAAPAATAAPPPPVENELNRGEKEKPPAAAAPPATPPPHLSEIEKPAASDVNPLQVLIYNMY